MKKLKKIIVFFFLIIVLTSCNKKEEYTLNKEITLTGTITNSEIIKNNETHYISIFNLNEPITIDGTTVNKIELDYDKELKENTEITIKGIIENNKDTTIDLKYSFSVLDIDDILSYINTFSNEIFSMTIPTSLIKISTVKEIEDGFIVYSSSNMDVGGEVFRIVAVSKSRYNELRKNETTYIETLKSSNNLVIIMMFPNTNEYKEETQSEYETIANQASKIKETIRLK